jgi:hypothetical protein
MSAVHCNKNQLIYTGGHDGSLLAWNFETGSKKYDLSANDKTCMSEKIITKD